MKRTNIQQMQLDCLAANDAIREIQTALGCEMSSEVLEEMLESGGFLLCQFLLNKAMGMVIEEDITDEERSKGFTEEHYAILQKQHGLSKERILSLYELTQKLNQLWMKYDLIVVEGRYIVDEHVVVMATLTGEK